MNLRILLFAGLAETCGSTCLEVELPAVCTVADLRNHLLLVQPKLKNATYRVAVNSIYAEDHQALFLGVEVALIPPVSGG
ncbi:MAG: MoaD/ThiS family protein [Planctomycetota bacterium]|nr:MoaD/ThiS family protein [Planctomycetota bacterium]MDA1112932.1 MoaD/ThiS family protein [Planctomycetota bacterium]